MFFEQKKKLSKSLSISLANWEFQTKYCGRQFANGNNLNQ